MLRRLILLLALLLSPLAPQASTALVTPAWLQKSCAAFSMSLLESKPAGLLRYNTRTSKGNTFCHSARRWNGGNWSWRYRADMLHDGVLGRLADVTELYGRWARRG